MALPETKGALDDSRVIHHELGHWLMARELGFTAGQIFLKRINGKASGYAKVYPRAAIRLDSAELVESYLENRIMVLLSGVIAEIEWYKKIFGEDEDSDYATRIYNNGVIDHSGLGDRGKAEELLVVLAGIKNDPTAKYTDLTTQIRTIFVELYEKAQDLAGRFIEKLNVMADLIKDKEWQSNGILVVTCEELVTIEAVASERVAALVATD